VREPLVTIAIPSYQCASFVAEAMDSALSQDFESLEVLVIDDGSTDGTREVVAGYSDPRLRVLFNEENIGPGRTWNRLLEEARGRYVRVMGCDDVLLPGSVSAQVAVMEADPAVVIVTGPREIITQTGRVLVRRGNGGLSGRVPGAVAGAMMVRRGENVVGEPCAALLRVSAIDRVGGFLEENPYTIDMDLWVRLLEVGDLHVLSRPTCQYRLLPGSWSATVASSQDADVIELVRRTAERGAFGTAMQDAEAGGRRAVRLARGRRLVYHVLFDLEVPWRSPALLSQGLSSLFGYVAFAVLYPLFHARFGYAPVLVVSYAVMTLGAYLGRKRVDPLSEGESRRGVGRFAIVYVIALGVNVGLFRWLTATPGSNPYVVQAAFAVAVAVCACYANGRSGFRQKGE
jgi:hypothetical protein